MGSALIGILVYLLLFAFFSRLLRNSTSTLRLMLLKQMRPQARYLLPLLALVLALPTTPLPERFKAPFEHFLTLCVIGILGWLMITLVQVFATLIRTRYSIAVENNLHARRIHTQNGSAGANLHRVHRRYYSSRNAGHVSPGPPNRHQCFCIRGNCRRDRWHGRALDVCKLDCRPTSGDHATDPD